jgi:heterodisulfide reductase subunit A2
MIADESLRIGVYVCHCGTNIAGMVDVEALAKFAETLPHVALARQYKYMCSDPGQELVKRDIAEFNLNRIVVAACSPSLHEPTFRRAAEDAGLNRFLVQMVPTKRRPRRRPRPTSRRPCAAWPGIDRCSGSSCKSRPG